MSRKQRGKNGQSEEEESMEGIEIKGQRILLTPEVIKGLME